MKKVIVSLALVVVLTGLPPNQAGAWCTWLAEGLFTLNKEISL